ncbi:MAG TPA: hypothetical protein VHB20_13300 [Verrucomicrobiae bacterium]|jgi:hypothetical protein|nr:hypothetical protein [Verrucomicrobiae bacterium]
MKFVRVNKSAQGDGTFTFLLSKRDRNFLLSILKLFPMTETKSLRVSQTSAKALDASQDLLVEAMAEQQRQHAKKIERLLKRPSRFFHETEGVIQLVLNGEQMEWMLQALNDIRVGSWTRLGCPEMEAARKAVRTEESAAHYTAMELSGYFEAALLEGFRHT